MTSIRPSMTPIGPVHVRMTGVVRGDDKGPGVEAINAPTAAEAAAALHRAARVNGADNVISVSSDYRRAAIAGGAHATQWRIEVQAWGTAVAAVAPAADEKEAKEAAAEADRKTKEAEDAAKAKAKVTADAAQDSDAAKDRHVRATETQSGIDNGPRQAAPTPEAPASPPTTDGATAPAASSADTAPAPSPAPTAPAPAQDPTRG